MKKLMIFNLFLAGLKLFSSAVKEQSIILTTYTYPGNSYWEKVVKMGGEKISYVIINPSSGPGKREMKIMPAR